MAVLNEFERKTLNDYLNEHKERIVEQKLTAVQVASQIREVLKIDVSEGNITARVGHNGRLYFHQWPGSEAARAGRAGSVLAFNQLVMQTNQLKAWCTHAYQLMVNYGFQLPPPGSSPEFIALAKQANEQLADTDQRDELEK